MVVVLVEHLWSKGSILNKSAVTLAIYHHHLLLRQKAAQETTGANKRQKLRSNWTLKIENMQ